MLDRLKQSRLVGQMKQIPGNIRSMNWPGFVRSLFRKPLFLTGLAVLVLLVLSAAGYGVWLTQQPPEQPIQFPHNIHVGFGVQCLYCHPGAWKGPSAGLPTETKCWGCHQQIPIKNGEQQKLADAVKNNQPIEWVPVFILPDFVYFNHRPHIAAGLNCETCHGEISREVTAQPRKGINMGWCLHCHRTRAAGNDVLLTRLQDCGTCHR